MLTPPTISLPNTGKDVQSLELDSPAICDLNIEQSTKETVRGVSCCDILCRCKATHLHSATVDEWMAYLDDDDDNAVCGCYYKAKLLWTWLWLMFGCCHCIVCRKKAKAKRLVSRLFTATHQLETSKYYFGVENASLASVRGLPSTTTQQTKNRLPKTPGTGMRRLDIVMPTMEESVTRDDANGCVRDVVADGDDGKEEEINTKAIQNTITPQPRDHQTQVSTGVFQAVTGLGASSSEESFKL